MQDPAGPPTPPTAADPEPRAAATGQIKAPPGTPVGSIAVMLFEVYFLLLGVATTYALWTIWPYASAPSTVLLFGFPIDFKNDPDARLMLVAVLSGLLGALIHVTTSFSTYLGNRQLEEGWIPWFVLRPLIGMTLGLLFYFIVRAGLVTSSGANAVNPFGIAAISGLAGLFSKQTVDKLREVFENAFPVTKGGDKERGGGLAPTDPTAPAPMPETPPVTQPPQSPAPAPQPNAGQGANP